MPTHPEKPTRTIAIGDIHGCAQALAALIDAIQPCPQDEIVTLGDYIDGGPDSRGVIDQLLALSGRCRLVPLMGNHEQMLLAALESRSELAGTGGGNRGHTRFPLQPTAENRRGTSPYSHGATFRNHFIMRRGGRSDALTEAGTAL